MIHAIPNKAFYLFNSRSANFLMTNITANILVIVVMFSPTNIGNKGQTLK